MAQTYIRELTAKEKRAIRRLVIEECANYDEYYSECVALHTDCYMFTIAFNTSSLCKYFKSSVLPLDPALEAVFTGQAVKPCKQCGRKFPVRGHRAYCSDACAVIARKAGTAARVRKRRAKM